MAEESRDDILTIAQTAKLLKVSSRIVYDLVSEERILGKIFAKKVGRNWIGIEKEKKYIEAPIKRLEKIGILF